METYEIEQKTLDPKRIIKLIKQIRKDKGWTQLYMAAQLKITQSSYGKIERGDVDITISKLFKILKAINQKPNDFFVMLSQGGYGFYSVDPELNHQIASLKSEMKLQKHQIEYLNEQLGIRDMKIAELKGDNDFDYHFGKKPENKFPPF